MGPSLAIGLAALASWSVGAYLCLPASLARRVTVVASLVFAAYLAIVLFVSRSFAVAIAHYLPAAAFLLVAFILAWRRTRARILLSGVAGVVLTFVAAGVQQGGIGLDPRYFDHNALYHSIQAVALLLIFLAARALLNGATAGPSRH